MQGDSGALGSRAAGRREALLLVAAFALLLVFGALPMVGGLVAAPALAAVSRPVHSRLTRRVGPTAGALIIIAALLIVLVLPGAWLASVAVHQVPAALGDVHRRLDALRAASPPLASLNVDSLIVKAVPTSAGWLTSALGPTLGAVSHGVVNLSIALLGLYFLLATGDAGWDSVRRRLPFSGEGSDELRRTFSNASRATLLGTLLSAALQGTSIGIGLRLIGNGAPAFWGAIAAFTTLVPVVGNALVWVPAAITPLVQREYGAAVIMVILGKAVPAILDRVVRTSISRHVGNLHPMVTLVGVLIGVRLLGAVGVLVGPALVQSTLALVQLFEREYGITWNPAAASHDGPDSAHYTA